MLYVVGVVYGVAELDNVLYVVTLQSSIIETWDVDTLSSLGGIYVQGMKRPNDIVVCRHDRQLYVADYNYCIWRVSPDDHSYVKWLPTKSTDTFRVDSVSVTSRGLLVTSPRDPASLYEYSMTDRQLLRVVKLPGFVKNLHHGVGMTRGTFVICHVGTSQDEEQSAVSYHINSYLSHCYSKPSLLKNHCHLSRQSQLL